MKIIHYIFGLFIIFLKKIKFSKLASESRVASLRISGAKIGTGVTVRPGVTISNCSGVTIGDGCYLGENTTISATGSKISVGANTLIAPNCMIVARQHIIHGRESIKFSGYDNKAISIQSDCWIGAGCTILSGVTIGQGSVVAAGAVVNKNIVDFTICGGIPARMIKQRL